MPNELDFMKTRDEKGMPEEEFNKVRSEWDKKAEDSGIMVKKAVFVFMGILMLSFAALNIAGLAVENMPNFSFVALIAFPIILALFLYDPKVEADKKFQYEKDQKIILKFLQDKIKMDKVKLGAIIVIGLIAVIVNIGCWWFIFDVMGEPILL